MTLLFLFKTYIKAKSVLINFETHFCEDLENLFIKHEFNEEDVIGVKIIINNSSIRRGDRGRPAR